MDLGKIDIECPECNASMSVALSDVAAQKIVRCRNGHRVKLEDKGGGVRKADKAMKDLDKALGNLGGKFKF